MSEQSQAVEVERFGRPAPLVRILGWSILAVLVAFMVNNALIVGFGVPDILSLLGGKGGAMALVPAAIYLVSIILAVIYVLVRRDTSLRWDADLIHRFNLYFIRACFWSVVLVGVVDATIALMRVEKLLEVFFAPDTVRSLGLARFVGPYIHLPLIGLSFVIAAFTRTLGFVWLALMIVVAELLIVISRFVFSYEQALMGDLVRYWYAALFLFASAYTLYDEGHVRVDVLYAGFSGTTRGFVNAIGSLFLGATTCWVILAIGLGGRQAIINAPVVNFEITQTGSIGMFVKYQMAAFLAIFAISMLIQFVSYFFEAVADFREEPGHRNVEPVSH